MRGLIDSLIKKHNLGGGGQAVTTDGVEVDWKRKWIRIKGPFCNLLDDGSG